MLSYLWAFAGQRAARYWSYLVSGSGASFGSLDSMQRSNSTVPWCVSREGGQSSGACCGCGASRMSGVARRRASMPVCVHASLPPSLLGRPSVIGYREARPCQARVVRTLYSCEARRWVHGTQRGEQGSCARCVRTMQIMLCYVML